MSPRLAVPDELRNLSRVGCVGLMAAVAKAYRRTRETVMPVLFASPQRAEGVQTRAELEALMRSREELSEQLERITEQRGELAQQRLNAEARAQHSANPALDRRLMQEYEQQISQLGERGGQLRGQIAQADEAIANAIARGVGSETEGPPGTSTVITVPGSGDFSSREALIRDRYESMMIAEAAALILASVFIGRLLWRRARKRTAALFASAEDVNSMRVAIDAIAVEVERISENQRYATKLLQERAEAVPRFESAGGSKVGAEVHRGDPPAR